ncbi:hypothetical protein KY342_03650 [Candidatus Woesearchaeota archaeon]|nr:hypothetical protein [Candidatus Woesearchaeota archaeon]
MQLEILDKKEEELLSRTAIKAHITFDKATPSNQEIKKQIASESKADETLVVVKNVYTEYGRSEADVNAYIYKSKEELQKIEPQPKKKAAKPGTQTSKSESDSSQKKPAPKPAEAPKEEKKEEAKPAEEKKQEAPKKEAKPAEEKPAEEKKE